MCVTVVHATIQNVPSKKCFYHGNEKIVKNKNNYKTKKNNYAIIIIVSQNANTYYCSTRHAHTHHCLHSLRPWIHQNNEVGNCSGAGTFHEGNHRDQGEGEGHSNLHCLYYCRVRTHIHNERTEGDHRTESVCWKDIIFYKITMKCSLIYLPVLSS